MLPVYRRGAMWLSFAGAWWRPSALKVAVGGVNAVSGEPLDLRIEPGRQDYLVCPEQPWLDGVNAGEGYVRQFVATALGAGDTVEEQLTGVAERGGLQLVVIEPRAGLFPAAPPRPQRDELVMCMDACASPEMGLGVGGRMRQEIFPDEYGPETWDPRTATLVEVHLCAAESWRALTGQAPPPSPVSARTYTEWGLPWFDLYSERGDLAGVEELERLRPVPGEDPALEVPPWQVVPLHGEPSPWSA